MLEGGKQNSLTSDIWDLVSEICFAGVVQWVSRELEKTLNVSFLLRTPRTGSTWPGHLSRPGRPRLVTMVRWV